MAVENVRIDKWLWAVRIFKTRSLAAEACRAGHVSIAGQPVKPSRSVRPCDVIVARTGEITRTVKVRELIDRRVGAKIVNQYLEDQTPASEYQKPREKNFLPVPLRGKGEGRPTKKDRRAIDLFRE